MENTVVQSVFHNLHFLGRLPPLQNWWFFELTWPSRIRWSLAWHTFDKRRFDKTKKSIFIYDIHFELWIVIDYHTDTTLIFLILHQYSFVQTNYTTETNIQPSSTNSNFQLVLLITNKNVYQQICLGKLSGSCFRVEWLIIGTSDQVLERFNSIKLNQSKNYY